MDYSVLEILSPSSAEHFEFLMKMNGNSDTLLVAMPSRTMQPELYQSQTTSMKEQL